MIDGQTDKADIGGYGELALTWLVALGLLFVLTWLLVRVAGSWLTAARARAAASARGPIRVLARTSLGGAHGLHVVEVGGKTLLLATGERGVRLLTEVDGAVVEDALDDLRRTGRRSFHELFQAALRRRWSPEASPEASPDDAGEPELGAAERDGRLER